MKKTKKRAGRTKKLTGIAIASTLIMGLHGLANPLTVEAQAVKAEFSYTGSVQTWTAPATGKYKLELWGAEGGKADNFDGGKGGFASGERTFNAGEIVYIYVGEKGKYGGSGSYTGGWNGGGNAMPSSNPGYSGSGGGSTDIRTVGGAWNNASSLNSRIIVAGAGGGASGLYMDGGDGGGLVGTKPELGSYIDWVSTGQPGTQSAGGAGGKDVGSGGTGSNGGFGYGGNAGNVWNYTAGGGGGGWYGGGGGTNPGAGGGGSSYVGSLQNSKTIGGNAVMTAPGGENEMGHSGHGFVRISSMNAPVLTATLPPNNSYYKQGSSFSFSGTISDPDNAGSMHVKYKIDNGTPVIVKTLASNSNPQSYNTTVTIPTNLVDGNHVLSVWAEDDSGWESNPHTFTFNVDNTAPQVSYTLTNGTGSLTLTLTATDTGSGVKRITKPDGTQTNGSTITYTIIKNGTYKFIVEDNAGNLTEKSITILSFDETAPVLTLTPNTTSLTNGNVTITASATDNKGVKRIKLPDSTYVTGSSATFQVTANGTYSFEAEDDAGNLTKQSITISNIDKTAPADPSFVASVTAPTNQDVDVTITYPADATVKQYKIGTNGTWTNYTTAIKLTANATLYARAYDGANNVSNEVSFTVNNIDKVAPTITLTPSTTSVTNQDVVISVTINESGSGVAIKKYASGNQTASFFANGGTTLTGNTFNVLTNGVYTVYAKDQAGNETVKTINVANIDKTAPADPSFVASITAPTSQDVDVTITYPSDATVKQYKIGTNGTWTTYTSAVKLSANATLFARAYDGANNVSNEVSFNVNNIDKTAPIITLTPSITSATNQDVIITAGITESGSGIAVKKYASGNQTASFFATGGTTLSGNTFSVSTNGVYTFYVKDQAGNESIKTINVTNIDKTAPTDPSFVASVTAPTNTDVDVTITYPADATVKQYKIGTTGTWTTYTSTIKLSANATLYARAYDGANNVSNEVSFNVNNIDKTAPVITLTPSITGATNQDVIITAGITETGSGIAVKKYTSGNQTASFFATGGTTLTGNTFSVSTNGVYSFYAKDQAGNETVKTINVTNIDKTPPTDPSFVASITAPTNQDVDVTITYPADATVKQYKIGATGTWTSYTSSVKLNANVTLFARAYDGANNVSNEVSFNVNNIDKIAPTLTLTPSTTGFTNKTVTVTVTSTDSGSGIALKKYAPGNQSANFFETGGATLTGSSFNVSANGVYTVFVKDNAGNATVKTINVTNIDSSAPEVSMIPSTTNVTNQDIVVTVNASDAGSGIALRKYAMGVQNASYFATGGMILTEDTFKVSTNGQYTVYVKDQAGNETVKTINVTNIDKTPPSDPSFVASITAPTNQDVEVTITFPDDATTKQYKIGANGTWTNYISSVRLSANATLYARAYDGANNVSNEVSFEVDNIDKTPPADPTFVASITAPTNQDVEVTISFPDDATIKQYKIGENGVWTNYVFAVKLSANGTLYARAYDGANNVSNEVSFDVNNIDKTAPTEPSFDVSVTAPTNQNVEVTITYPDDATVKQYKIGTNGTWSNYTSPLNLSANATLYARAYDRANNVSKEVSFEVKNIDKMNPTAPSISLENNKLVVIPGSDQGSGVKDTLIRINQGEWKSYITSLIVEDGEYEIQAKTVDEAGNESEVTTLHKAVYGNALTLAKTAVDHAKAGKSQGDIDQALRLVNQLPASPEKDELLAMLNRVQSEVDLKKTQDEIQIVISKLNSGRLTLAETKKLREELKKHQTVLDSLPSDMDKGETSAQLEDAMEKAKLNENVLELTESSNASDIKSLEDVVNQLPNGPLKDSLLEKLKDVSVVTDADDQVELLEGTLTIEDLNKAKELVAKLPDSTQKQEYLVRLKMAENKVMAKDALATVEETISDSDFEKANEAVTNVEDSTFKDSLVQRLEAIKPFVEANTLVELSVKTRKQSDINEARIKVSSLMDGEKKETLHTRLDLYDTDLRTATSKVKNAETFMTMSLIQEAEEAVLKLVDSSRKNALVKRVGDLKKKVEEGRFKQQIAEAENKVELAERMKRNPYIADAWVLVNALPVGSEKDELHQRLNAINTGNGQEGELSLWIEINAIEDSAVKNVLSDTLKAVERAEKSPSRANIVYALNKVETIPSGILTGEKYSAIVGVIQERINKVKQQFNANIEDQKVTLAIQKATTAVEQYEKYKTSYFKARAQEQVNTLPDGETKIQLQLRIDTVSPK